MHTYVRELIDAGTLTDDAATDAALRRVSTHVYRQLHERRPMSFAFLSDISFPAVLAFMRALSLAEKARLSPYPGSASLLIPAFFACRCRTEEELAAVADWIVTHHENPYTPFSFRRTRAYWEEARRTSASPIETYRLVQKMETDEARARFGRAKRHEVEQGIQRLRKGEAPESPELRDRMLREMEREMLE